MPAEKTLTPELRAAFGTIADFLIPAYNAFPAATTVGVHEHLLDDVLGARPDIAEAFFRGVAAIDTRDISASVNAIFRDDPGAFNAVSLAASGGYYMAPEVRRILGYPGQESLTYDSHQVQAYLTDGTLERVVRRGPIYRATPHS